MNTSNAGDLCSNVDPAPLYVFGCVNISKSYNSSNVKQNGGPVRLTISINNTNTFGVRDSNFSDPLPSGLSVGGLIDGTGGSAGCPLMQASVSLLSWTNETLLVGIRCVYLVDVLSSSATGQTSNVGTVTSPLTPVCSSSPALLYVLSPAVVNQRFIPNSVCGFSGQSAILEITVRNPNPSGQSMTGIIMTSILPAGMTVFTIPPTPVNGGSITNTSNSVTWSGGLLPGGVTETIRFNVSTTYGVFMLYTVLGANVTADNAALSSSVPATLSVMKEPDVLVFYQGNPITVPVNNGVVKIINISNPNAFASITGLTFSDVLPATLNAMSVSQTAGCTAAVLLGGRTISLIGGVIPAGGFCAYTIMGRGVLGGVANNPAFSIRADNICGNLTNQANLYVVGDPMLFKSYTRTSIPIVTGMTTLNITLFNNNSVALTVTFLNDTIPAQLIPSNPQSSPGNDPSCPPIALNGNVASFSTITIAAFARCEYQIDILAGPSEGFTMNTVTFNSTESNIVNASAPVYLVTNASACQEFRPSSFAQNTSSTLFIFVNNTNSVSITNAGFVSYVQTGLNISNVAVLPAVGGTLSFFFNSTLNQWGIELVGGTLPANSNTTFTVTITSNIPGNYTSNSFAITSDNAPLSNTCASNVYVLKEPDVSKSYSHEFRAQYRLSQLYINISNGNDFPMEEVRFVDVLPTGFGTLIVQSPGVYVPSTGSTVGCPNVAANSTAIQMTSSTIPSLGVCSVRN